MVGQGVHCLSLELGRFTISVEDVLCMLLMASTSLWSHHQTAVSLVVVAKWKVPMSEGHKDKQYPHNTQEALTHPELFCREISHSFSNISDILGSGDYRQPVLVIPYWKYLSLKAKKQFGLFHQHLSRPQGLPMRDYTSSQFSHILTTVCVWDPHQAKHKEILSSVQAFASKVVRQNWTAPQQQRLSILKWSCLDNRRQVQKLIMCWKIVNGQSCIPPSA